MLTADGKFNNSVTRCVGALAQVDWAQTYRIDPELKGSSTSHAVIAAASRRWRSATRAQRPITRDPGRHSLFDTEGVPAQLRPGELSREQRGYSQETQRGSAGPETVKCKDNSNQGL